MDLTSELDNVIDALERARIDYALCGGIAVVIHGYPRLTQDIDMLIQPNDLDAVRQALAGVGFELESGFIPFDLGTPRERRSFA